MRFSATRATRYNLSGSFLPVATATGYGFIVDANTNEIVQVIFDYQTPFTGSTGVQTTNIALEYSGEFEIVFRVGSYDWDDGQFIGAELDLGYAGILQLRFRKTRPSHSMTATSWRIPPVSHPVGSLNDKRSRRCRCAERKRQCHL